MSWYAEAMRRAGRTRWFAAVGSRLAPPVDRLLHRLSGGRLHVAESFLPTLLLTTTGRRSGEPRTQPLAYVRDGAAFVVVGTNWGGTTHPAWTHNLRAEPRAVVEARGERYDVVARELDDEEAARIFPYHRKSTGHLLSKHRFVSAPFALTLETGAWLKHAQHANTMATALDDAQGSWGSHVSPPASGR